MTNNQKYLKSLNNLMVTGLIITETQKIVVISIFSQLFPCHNEILSCYNKQENSNCFHVISQY